MMATHQSLPSSPRVYVIPGCHTSFHHSGRGHTPGEAGFGTDIGVVRRILDLLETAPAGRCLACTTDGPIASGFAPWLASVPRPGPPRAGAVSGSIKKASLFSMMPSESVGTLLRLVGYSLAAVLRARLARS
jgi:hypothetical protein